MALIKVLLSYIVFPGFLFSAVIGAVSSWVDRKVTARLQYRVGPPWYQPFADFFKLLGKETFIPKGASKIVFLGAPLVGLAAVILVSTMLWHLNADVKSSYIGDLIVVVYLLTLPSFAIIIGGSSAGNPLASIGSSREMKLILAYELPFIIAIFTVVAKTGTILIGCIIELQGSAGLIVTNISGLAAFIVAVMAVQAKLGFVPFDIPEAEQEIAAGPLVEYSGPPLAIYKLTKNILFYVLSLFLVTLFWGGVNFNSYTAGVLSILKYILMLVIIIVIKNVNPRLRTDQALRFFWGPMTFLAAAGMIFALLGF